MNTKLIMLLVVFSNFVFTTDRIANAPIQELLLRRWSPRAMSGESVSVNELRQLFEAARWAPSSYNEQPWRFIYAFKGSTQWDRLFDLLVPFNKSWACNASALILILSKKTFTHDGSINNTHSFDVGSAWQNFALEGSAMGLVVHGMAGFDSDRARQVLTISDEYAIEAMIAVGKPASRTVLPDYMQSSETPSARKSVDELISDDSFCW